MNDTKQRLYLVKSNKLSDYAYYVKHGYFKGKRDVISYGTKKMARVFTTEKEATEFLLNKLPEWGRSEHFVEELDGLSILMHHPELYHACSA